MLKRTSTALSWPRLVAIASGTFGAAVTAATALQVSAASSFRPVHRPPELIAFICGCVFLFLAFPLFTGREWARRVLLVAVYCTLAAVAISFSLMLFQQAPSPSSPHSVPASWIGICALVAFLIPPAFILAALHHADIRRTFRARDASNQSLQPTAGRQENYEPEIRK